MDNLLHQVVTLPLADAKVVVETAIIKNRMALYNGNIDETAQSLGILSTNLYRKMRELGIENYRR